MGRSKAVSPHAWVSVDVDYANVESVRSAVKDEFRRREGVALTFLPFIARAVIDALRQFPLLNATIGVDELIINPSVNLGIAVDLDFDGLIVVVNRGAEQKRLRTLATDTADLADAARRRTIKPDQIAGSTFTITNVGSYGAANAMPIINQPEIAVLATGTITPQPAAVALPDGGHGVAVHPRGSLGLAWDHRAVDGAYASAFLSATRTILETRDWKAEVH